jgi:hypothetical protein
MVYGSRVDDREPLTVDEAERWLEGLPLVPAMGGKLTELKPIRDRCLAAGIPALIGCPAGSGGGG